MTAPTTDRRTASFEARPEEVARARSFVRTTLAGWGLDALVADAVLIVSELVTNAVVHAGTTTEVSCAQTAQGLQIDVADHYPGRWLPPPPAAVDDAAEGGRGIAMTAELSSAWGVSYTASTKRVWFVLPIPGAGARARAAPAGGAALLVGTVRLEAGRVVSWGAEADQLLGWSSDDVRGRAWTDLVEDSGDALSVEQLLGVPRWSGTYTVRGADGRPRPVFASHVASDDPPAVECVLVPPAYGRLLAPVLGAPSPTSSAAGNDDAAGLSDADTVQLELDDLLQRTVERARDALLGDAAYALLALDDTDEVEVRAVTGLPAPASRSRRLPAGRGARGRLASDRMPVVHGDMGPDELPPLLRGTGMRSLVSVPLLAEGRVIGTLAVAARSEGRFDNDTALRLQRTADRVALAVRTAALAELESMRRGWLSFLAEASDLLAGTLDVEMTLAMIGQLVVPRLSTWCAVYLDNDLGDSRLASVWHASEERTDALRSLLDKVPPPERVPGRTAVPWVAASELDLRGSLLESAHELARDPAVAVALVARGRTLGTLVLGRPDGDTYRRDVLDLTEDLSRRAALALDNARLYGERAATARALQRSLLPPELPRVPGLDIGVAYEAAGAGNEVGGDFYDVFSLGDGSWGFAIGDVCGKGPEAAAVTGLARQALRLLGRERLPVPDVMARLNAAILDEGPRARFLTVVSGQVTPLPGGGARLTLVNAGHPQPRVLRPDGTVTCAGTQQPLLGVLDDVEFSADAVDLARGEVLVLVTDGVTERRDGRGMLGDDGLEAVLRGCAGLSAAAVAGKLQRAVMGYSREAPRDDLAILVLRAV